MSRPPVTWKATFWVVVTLALGLRLFQLGQNSLWIDEIASLRTIAGSFWEVAEAAMRHNAFEPPLYFWLLDIAAQLFGMSEVGVRLVSAIAGALTIPVVWLLAREMTRREDVAALCATLLALNPLHIWYSQEARPYALMVLFGSAALLFFARAARSGSTRDWAGFAIATALALLSHVFGGTALLTAWAWALLRGNQAALRPLLGASLAVVILIAPFYVPLFHATVIATNVGAHPRALTGLEIPYTVYTYLGGYSFGPSQREIQDLGFQAALTQNLGQVAVAVILLTIALALAAARRTAASLAFAILFALPIVLAFVGSAVTTKPYSPRYTLLGLVGALALLSVAIIEQRGWRRAILVGLFCGASLWSDVQWFWVSRYWKEDSRGAVSWLTGTLPAGARVGVAPAYMERALAHYVSRQHSGLCVLGVDGDEDFAGGSVPDALLLSRRHHLPRWRQLERAFEREAGARPATDSIVGYRILLGEPPRSDTTRAGDRAGCR